MDNLPKPAYVRFEYRPVENRTETIEAGHIVYDDVLFAIVTPAGTRDQVEKPAEDWLNSVREGVQQERIPAEWLDSYTKALQRFRDSNENTEFGTSIKEWPAATPAQIKTCLAANILSIEDLAAATEEAVSRIGMGGRALKAKAQAWLDSSATTGIAAEELNALRQKNEELEARDKEREAQFLAMSRRLEALEGTPALVEEE